MLWYSPPLRLVGIEMTRMVGSFQSVRLSGLADHIFHSSSELVTEFASIHAMTLAPSVMLPAPRVTMQSGFRGKASWAMERTSEAWVCGAMPMRVPTTWEPRADWRRLRALV